MVPFLPIHTLSDTLSEAHWAGHLHYTVKPSQVDAILLDFSKAFDKVDHSTLLLKMSDYGIWDNLLNWSVTFLQGRTQRGLVDGHFPTPALFILNN